MTQRGTVLNGVVVPDGPPLPEGTRALIEEEAVYEFSHPLAQYDEEKEIELLRQSLAMMDAGEQGRPVDEVFADLYQRLDERSNGKG